MIETLVNSGKVALFLAARPTYSFHVARIDPDDSVLEIKDVTKSDMWLNGGYFVFRREIFDYIREGEDLVDEPFQRLIAEQKLMAYPYEGFWAAMDTLKEKQHLDGLLESGQAPWARWERNGGSVAVDPARSPT